MVDGGGDSLTRTERIVADLYADGASFNEIAKHLGRSPHTVRSHLKNIYRKLGVRTKIALRERRVESAPRAVAARIVANEGRLLERSEALSTLDALLARATAEGRGATAVIRGEAGAGKTSVLNAFMAALPDGVLRGVGYCERLHAPRQLGTVRDVVSALTGRPGTPEAERLFEELFDGPAASRCVVAAFEDLHWVDEQTLDWIAAAARRLQHRPVLMLLTCRDDELPPSHPLVATLADIPRASRTDIELAPLSCSAVQELGSLNEVEAQRIHVLTGGNPFFVSEILAGDLRERLPSSIAETVDARLNRLPDAARRFIERMACFVGDVDMAAVRAILPEDAAECLRIAIEQAFLIQVGGLVRFRHELARRTALRRLMPFDVVDTHRAALLHFSRDPTTDPATVLHHAIGAGIGELVLEHALPAADEAARRGAHRDAARLMRAALPFARSADLRTEARINERFAEEEQLARNVDAAVIKARERACAIWERLDARDRLADNLRWLAWAHWFRGEPRAAERIARRAVSIFGRDPGSREFGRANSMMAHSRMLAGRAREAERHAETALRLASGHGDAETLASAGTTLGAARLWQGDRRGYGDLTASLTVAQDQGLHLLAGRAYVNMAEGALHVCDFDVARRNLVAGAEFELAHDLQPWILYLQGLEVQLAFMQGDLGAAVDLADGALGRPGFVPLAALPALVYRARAKLRRGDGDADATLEAVAAAVAAFEEPRYSNALALAGLERRILVGEDVGIEIQGVAETSGPLMSPAQSDELALWRALAEHEGGSAGTSPQRTDAASLNGRPFETALSLVGPGPRADDREADRLLQRIGAAPARRFLDRTRDVRLAPLRDRTR